MKKYVIRMVLAVVVLALAAGATGVFVLLNVDAGRIKNKVAQEVQRVTGRTFTVGGDIERTFGLSPGVTLHQVTLSGPNWASSPEMLKAETLRVHIRLLPLLLDNKIKLSELTVTDASVTLERSKKGTPSWQFAYAKPPKADALPDDQMGPPAPITFLIEQLNLNNVTLSYRNQAGGKKQNLAITQMGVRNLTQDGVEEFALQGHYKKHEVQASGSLSDQNLLMIAGSIKGSKTAIETTGSLALSDKAFDANVQASTQSAAAMLDLAGVSYPHAVPLTLSTTIGGTPDAIRFSDLKASSNDWNAKADGTLALSSAVPNLEAHIALDRLTVPKAEAKEDAEKPAQFDYGWMKQLTGSIAYDIAKLTYDTVTLEKLSGTAQLDGEKLALALTQSAWAGGSLTSKAKLEHGIPGVPYSLTVTAEDVMLGDVWSALTADAVVKNGKSKAALYLHGQAGTPDDVLRSAKGYARFFIDKMSYTVPESVQEVESFIELLRGRQDEKRSVNVQCAVGRFTIDQGTAKTKTLALKTSAAIAQGDGSIHLPDQTIDMLLKGRSGSIGLVDMVPALRISGPIASPDVSPDAGSALLNVGKLVLGAATGGIGLIAVLGEKAADRMGITEDNNPCLTELAEQAKELAEQPAVQPAAAPPPKGNTPTLKDVKDGVKSNLQKIEDDAKSLLGL